MYKLNLIVIVVLCVGVFGGATYLALGPGTAENAPPTIDELIRNLGDSDPDLRKEAEEKLLASGDEAVVPLRNAAKSKRRILASRARRLLSKMGKAVPVVHKSKRFPEPAPESVIPEKSPGVRLELSSASGGQVYVRMVNGRTIPFLVARESESGQISCGSFGWFESEDGRKWEVSGKDAQVDWVVVEPGEGIEVFVGVPMEGRKPVRIRFVYDATAGSEYRKLVPSTEKGAPLPPERIVSAWAELSSPGN